MLLETDLFVARRLPNSSGYTWTLALRGFGFPATDAILQSS